MSTVMDKWKSLIKTHLGKSCLKNLQGIVSDVMAVHSGTKPSVLFDRAAVSAKSMAEFLDNAMWERLIDSPLDVLCIKDDILIYNHSRMYDMIQSKQWYYTTIVDVSPNLESPVVLNPCGNALDIIIACKKAYDAAAPRMGQLRVLTIDDDVSDKLNLTTMFGLMLGYPVVYWYDIKSGGDNCLSMEPLIQYNIEAKLSVYDWCPNLYPVYCFSVPKSIKQRGDVFSKWYEFVKSNHFKEQFLGDIFSGFNVVEEEKVLPTVIM